MFGGGDQRRMSVDGESPKPLPINYARPLVIADPSAGQSSPFSRENVDPESIAIHSKKLEDGLKELGAKIKHHEQNVKFLKFQISKLDDDILDKRASIGNYYTSFSKVENEDSSCLQNEEETAQSILKYEKSVAAIFYSLKTKPEGQASNHPWMKDVVGVVAMLGKVNDANLSRLLSDYLGLETMLAVVCKTHKGVKALEAYDKDGSINKGLGIHASAASMGKSLDERFLLICLENLRPYAGQLIDGDPQQRLDLLKPKTIDGESPLGFLGFAVNMISIDPSDLYCLNKTGQCLRETLFYNLFSNLQVYKTREDMLKAHPLITHGAISLDGGVIRSPGVFSLGHHRGDVNVKFPFDSKKACLPGNYYEVDNQCKEMKWKKDRAAEDLQREQELLDHTRFKFEAVRQEYVLFLAESSAQFAKLQMPGRGSTPR
ncbi:protein DEFECTIVE IN MERISTEM SILENCING 3 [Andrographis paniculata]|uniref:protein DEFECTIVE IN MERISTEM SILENCING 3 n=1 Tax=Andrographis paniculata TaxID=175694 RepID=UPI0021E95B84|nr:protein DEFECTIVE IN MERISTEM SILENCING 3 [Andrographis paniculata]